jgi:hypothetical protein
MARSEYLFFPIIILQIWVYFIPFLGDGHPRDRWPISSNRHNIVVAELKKMCRGQWTECGTDRELTMRGWGRVVDTNSLIWPGDDTHISI